MAHIVSPKRLLIYSHTTVGAVRSTEYVGTNSATMERVREEWGRDIADAHPLFLSFSVGATLLALNFGVTGYFATLYPLFVLIDSIADR